jgi:hypothetical protein
VRARIKERLTATAQPFLEPGDVVQQAFRAGRLSSSGGKTRVNIIVATQDAVIVLGTSAWSTRKAKYRIARLPKSTPISLRLGELHIGEMRFLVNGVSAHPQARQLAGSE